MLHNLTNLISDGIHFLPKSGRDLYLDPGSTNFIIQLLIAMGVGSLFLIRTSWSKIKRFFTKETLVEDENTEEDFSDND
jgi:hypothetical protein